MKNMKKGISLITLIITIVVLIILSGGVILTLSNTGVIGKTKEAKFKTDLKSYDEEIRKTLGSEYTHDSSVVNRVITKKSDIEKYCKGLVDSNHIGYAYISQGVLTLRGNKITDEQRKWAQEAKIKIDNGEEIVVSDSEIITNLSETEWTRNDVTLTIVGLKDKNIKLHKTPYSFDNGETWVDTNSKVYTENTTGIYVRVRDEYEYIYTNPEIIIANIDKIPPTDSQEINIVSGLNTLTVMASGSTDNESGMAGYKYSIDGNTWTDVVPENETYIFDKLQPSTNITVYSKSVDNVGNESSGSKEVETSTLDPDSNITITLSTEDWTKGPINATISCDNIPLNYVLQYKLAEDTDYTNGSIISEIKKNTTITARLYYKEINSEIAKTKKTVENIDDKAPSKPTGISVTPGINTLEVKAYGSIDNESGLAGYKYSLDANVNWGNINTISEGTAHTFDSITSATSKVVYARAVDKVGYMSTEIEQISTSTEEISGKVAITLEYISGIAKYNDWTKKINVRLYHGSIPEGYELVYKLSSGSPTTFTTIANNSVITLDYNTTVTAMLYNPTLKEEVSSTLNTSNIGIIDNTGPSTPISLSLTAQGADTLTVSSSGSVDTGCGFNRYQYRIDGTSWSKENKITGLEAGKTYTVYTRAVDNLSNVSGVYSTSYRTLYQYTVSYNKNTTDTVSNMPSNETKTEGVNLKISSNLPERTGYTFLGWGETSDSTKVALSPGGTYTRNSNITLYAIWYCSGTGLTCNGPFTATYTHTSADYCSGGATGTGTCYNATASTVTCGSYSVVLTTTGSTLSCGHWEAGRIYECSGCGNQLTRYSSGCTYTSCENFNMNFSSPSNHTKTIYKCSTHNWSGNSSSHLYSYTSECTHGFTNSHYYCTIHNYEGNYKSHDYTDATTCTHGNSSSHSYCTHGKIKEHYGN